MRTKFNGFSPFSTVSFISFLWNKVSFPTLSIFSSSSLKVSYVLASKSIKFIPFISNGIETRSETLAAVLSLTQIIES